MAITKPNFRVRRIANIDIDEQGEIIAEEIYTETRENERNIEVEEVDEEEYLVVKEDHIDEEFDADRELYVQTHQPSRKIKVTCLY
jgi:hypothetical protein